MTKLRKPTREGYVLNEQGQAAYDSWLDIFSDKGCTCFICPPCSYCTHKGHPISIEETDEFWDKVEINAGDTVECLYSGHFYIDCGERLIVDKVANEKVSRLKVFTRSGSKWYNAENFKLVQEEENVSREDIVNKGSGNRGVWIGKPEGIPIKDELITITLTQDNPIFENYLNTKEETKMSNTNTSRKVVSVQLIDRDSALPVEDSLVHDFGQVITDDSQDVMIQQLIVDNDMREIIGVHNEIRAGITNQDILNRTGVSVKLQPVRLKDLFWQVK